MEAPRLKSIEDIKKLIPQLLAAAQAEYDAWDDPDGQHMDYAGGGICHLIADEIAGVLNSNGIEATTISASVGEQHVWAVAKVKEGVVEVDIPPSNYEQGGGYNWTKNPDVVFDASDLHIGFLSHNPKDFTQYLDSY